MDTKALAAGVIGFLLGGLVVSVAAELEGPDDGSQHGLTTVESTVLDTTPVRYETLGA